jgi:hypothetical protein
MLLIKDHQSSIISDTDSKVVSRISHPGLKVIPDFPCVSPCRPTFRSSSHIPRRPARSKIVNLQSSIVNPSPLPPGPDSSKSLVIRSLSFLSSFRHLSFPLRLTCPSHLARLGSSHIVSPPTVPTLSHRLTSGSPNSSHIVPPSPASSRIVPDRPTLTP